MSKWITEPVTIGAITRYKLVRADGSETRGIWNTRKEASNLAFKLNTEEWEREVFGEEDWIDDELDELELLHI
jgi:hypothetical protein